MKEVEHDMETGGGIYGLKEFSMGVLFCGNPNTYYIYIYIYTYI